MGNTVPTKDQRRHQIIQTFRVATFNGFQPDSFNAGYRDPCYQGLFNPRHVYQQNDYVADNLDTPTVFYVYLPICNAMFSAPGYSPANDLANWQAIPYAQCPKYFDALYAA